MNSRKGYRLILAVALLTMQGAAFAVEQPRPKVTWEPSRNWLSEAPTAQDAFKRIERYLGGFGQRMREIGERFEIVHDAISRKNYDLAAFQWNEIGNAMVSGYLTRPQFRANAEGMFLNAVFPDFKAALTSGDPKKIASTYEIVRQTCMACHVAERVAFINGHPLFRRTANLNSRG